MKLSRKFLVWLVLIFIGLSFLLYGNNLNGDFVYDDVFFSERPELKEACYLNKIWLEPYIPQNKDAGAFRPLAVFSYALNFILFGDSTLSFHLFNVLLNAAVVFLVFFLVFKLFGDKNLAVISALFFAFLPIHTEAVNFIKAREELLSAFFALSAWLVFLSAAEPDISKPDISKFRNVLNYQKLFFSSFLFLLAVLSKELIFVVPLLFLAVYWINPHTHTSEGLKTKPQSGNRSMSVGVKENPGLTNLVKTAATFIPASLIYVIMRYLALGSYAFGKEGAYFLINPTAFVGFWTRIWTAFKITFIYIGKTFIPVNLSASYHYNHLTLVSNPFSSMGMILGVLFLSALVYLIFNQKLRSTPLGIASLIFLVPYSVFSKFFFTAGEIVGERWMYFPSIGLSIIAGYFIWNLIGKKKILGGLVLASVLFVYTLVIIPRNKVWANEENLYKNMIKTASQSGQAHFSLALWYLENNFMEGAIKEADIAFKIYPDHPPLLNLIGRVAFLKGDYSLAEDAYLKAIELRPKFAASYSNLAKLYYQVGEYEGAKDILEVLIKNLSQPSENDLMLYEEVFKKLNEK